MKEELLRIENGLLPVKNKKIILDLEISRGECVGIFPDSISDSDMIPRDYGSENGKNIYL